jgi:3-hydroxybutyryl-CoA dehydrogenase
MGSGIAEVAARAGFQTIVREVDAAALAAGQARVERSMATAVSRGKLAADEADSARRRLRYTVELGDLAVCDVVIEAATEKPDVKLGLFRTLDSTCRPDTVLASNTSSIPIVELAAATKRPDRVVGMHFFNPAPVMPLIELVRSIQTSDETMERVRTVGAAMGKQVIVAKDRAGFIVNGLLVPYLLDAVRMLEQGIATREDIDAGMRLGCGHPMGPLQLLDFIGIDTTHFIAEVMYAELKDPRYASPTLLKQMTVAGRHGRKSGKGFYDYERRT